MNKEEIIKGITDSNEAVLIELEKFKKDSKEIEDYKKEFYDLDRSLRDTQVEKIQKDKIIKKDNGNVLVKAVRTPINFQKKIVTTATAFEFGNPPKIKADETNDLNELVLKNWYNLRMDSKIQDLSIGAKSETEACMLFYIVGEPGSRKIKSKVYTSKDGTMAPYFNDDDDLIFFTWKFSIKENDKEVVYYWIYDETYIHKLKKGDNGFVFQNSEEHGFDKIPIVYYDQDQVEYEDVKQLIDRYEVCLSKLGNANDYTGHPILMLTGEVKGMPDKDDSGKVLYSPKEIDPNTQKDLTGDAKFITYDNAPESVKLELEQLRDFIGYITSTPDLSFNTLKSLGNVATETLQLMFLDPILKSKLREGKNRTMIQRCINIIESGLTNTIQTNLSRFEGVTMYEVIFQSVLPNNLTELMDNMAKGIDANIVSRKTAVETLSLTNDNDLELDNIRDNQQLDTEE